MTQRMSANRGRPEVRGRGQSDAIDPRRTSGNHLGRRWYLRGLKTVLRLHQHWNTDLREAKSCTDSIRSSTFVDDYLFYEKITQRISK
jgi:hypothetical protein